MELRVRIVVLAVFTALTVMAIGVSTGAARSKAAASVRVPNVTGRYLDVAENRLIANGLIPVEKGGGFFGILVKSNWQVCTQSPSPGRVVGRGSKVSLFVARPGHC